MVESQTVPLGIAFWYTKSVIKEFRKAQERMSKLPGKAHREGISLIEVARMFDTEEKAEAWFVEARWPDGIKCVHCHSDNIYVRENRKPMPYRCRSCKKYFSVRSKSVLQSSKLPLSKWGLAIYIYNTNLNGYSSMHLYRELEVQQKTAWFLLHRIRETVDMDLPKFDGEVEVDETFIGGKRKNKPLKQRKDAKGRGPVDMIPVVGVKDRQTNRVKARVVNDREKVTLQGFVTGNTTDRASVYTDEAPSYEGLPRLHKSVKHKAYEYVKEQVVHTNGIESFWSQLKNGQTTYRHFGRKHLHRYVKEFAGRHNFRPLDTRDQMTATVVNSVGRRLRWLDLIGEKETRYHHGLDDSNRVLL